MRVSLNASSPRILIVRPDRIGDVILSTPVITALKRQYPTAHITFMVRSLVAPLLRGMEGVDEVFVYEPDGRHRGVSGFFRLMEELKAGNFQIAVVLQSALKVAAALYGVGVPHRIGPLSKIHSFFFYNRGTRQRRSLVEMHETDYNLQLLRKLGIRVGAHQIPTRIRVAEPEREWARGWLKSQGWSGDEPHRHLVVIHPGMGGSALNWPESHYVDLARALSREGQGVLMTGGPAEASLLGRIREELEKSGDIVMYYGIPSTSGQSAQSIEKLAAVFSEASVVVAPSTGPLHIAVAQGRPVVSFYPPIRVQSAVRWGPYRADGERSSVLVPEVYCGEDFKCRGPVCHYFPCMKTITVRQAIEEVHQQLSEESRNTHAEKTATPAEKPAQT